MIFTEYLKILYAILLKSGKEKIKRTAKKYSIKGLGYKKVEAKEENNNKEKSWKKNYKETN